MVRVSLVLSMLFPICAFSQQSVQKPKSSFNSLISTPQAQQFQRYGDIPIDYSTGVPSISIPLGKVSIKNLEWPLELSYHAGGNKVGEVASNIGLGWTLKGIGMISTTTYGKPDTFFPLETDSMLMKRYLNLSTGEPSPGGCVYANIEDINRAEEVISVDKKNVLPDIYHLNIGTRIHKMFVLGDSAYTMPASDLKIKLNRTFVDSKVTDAVFFVVDEKGTKFYFSKRGYNKQKNFCAGTRFSSSENNYVFCLDSAVNVFNEKISFFYSIDTYSYTMPTFRQEFVNEHETWSPCFGVQVPPPVNCTPIYYAQEAKLDSLICSNGDKVTILYSPRTDLPSTGSSESGGARMTSVKFFFNNQQRFTYDFEQNYFISPGGTSAEFYRLKLSSVTLKDKNSLSVQKYAFSYNSKLLPERTSNSVDSAGYFNDIYNATNIPKFSDRSFNEAASKACILELIKYPTGGTTKFEYELNSPGYGGLRIKRITDSPLQGAPTIKKFVYKNYYPSTPSFTNTASTYYRDANSDEPIICDYWFYQSSPHRFLNMEYDDSHNLKYEEVEEIFGENGENGKILYRYGTVQDYGYSSTSKSYVLLEKKVFKKTASSYEVVKKETYKYSNFPDSTLVNQPFKISNNNKREKRVWGKEFTLFLNEATLQSGITTWLCFPKQIGEGSIVLVSNASLLTEKTITNYNGPVDSIVSTEKYGYSISDHLQPVKIETTNSIGEVIYTVIKYPNQFANITATDNLTKGIRNLKDNNIIEAVEVTSFIVKGATTYILSGTFNSYKSSQPLLDSILILKLASPVISSSFTFATSSAGKIVRDAQYTPSFIFSKYDTWGNLQEKFKFQDLKEVFLWGYNSQYPVAKIVGADYAIANQQVSSLILNNPSSDQALRTELNKLRTNLPNAKVTTYTYNTIWGITSETDPAGRTTYYEYDAMGRLKLIKDNNGNIVNLYEYRFQAPITQ